MSVFVDTGVLFAAASKKDARHRRAAELLDACVAERPFTSDQVVLECWALLRYRSGWSAAMAYLDALAGTPLEVEAVTAADLERARRLLADWADQELDLTDGTSFALMERLGCRTALSFDEDFAVYRFGPHRKAAFEIRR